MVTDTVVKLDVFAFQRFQAPRYLSLNDARQWQVSSFIVHLRECSPTLRIQRPPRILHGPATTILARPEVRSVVAHWTRGERLLRTDRSRHWRQVRQVP